jgi:hypothetical protein
MKTTIRLISKFVLAILIAFVIVPVSCAEAKLVVAPPPPPLPPANIYPPTNTIKKVSGLQKNAGVAKTDAGITSSAATQNDAQPLVIGPPPPTNILGQIGTLDKVNNTAARSVNRIFLFGTAYETNGSPIDIGGSSFMPNTSPFTNKVSLDTFIAAQMVSNALYFVVTNNNSVFDKSKGVLIEVDCLISTNFQSSQDIFYYFQIIQLVKNGISYSVPDLSGFSTHLNDSVPFYVPNLQWARVEVGYYGETYPFRTYDGLLDPETDPVGSDGFLYLPSGFITDSSTTNGDFWVKISLFANNSFKVANGDGNQVPEIPLTLGATVVGGNANIAVYGDSGKSFILDWSTNLVNWTTNSVSSFIPAVPQTPAVFPCPLSSANKMFFRTVTTSVSPY